MRVAIEALEKRLRILSHSVGLEGGQFAAFLEARPGFFTACFTIVYLLGTLFTAWQRPLWLDEIIAIHITGLPHTSDIWQALLRTTDGNPPLYYLMCRPLLRLVGDVSMAMRLPVLAGFWLAALCVFHFVRRRTSAVCGAIAALCFTSTGAYRWATEARPYGVALGLSGVALICWQRYADSSPRRILWLGALVASIACLVSVHYYSALFLAPLFFGETVRILARKRFDWGILAALALAPCAIFLWFPLLQGVRGNVAGNAATPAYFAAPSLAALYGAYEALFVPLLLPGVICIAVALLLTRSGSEGGPQPQPAIPTHEAAVAACLILYPCICLLVALFVTHTFVTRYVLPGAMGIGSVAGFLAYSLLGSRRALGTLLLVILYTSFAFQMLSLKPSERPYAEQFSFLQERAGGLPVVVTEGLAFTPLWYYAPAELQSRLFYVTDLPYARGVTDSTNEIITMKLKPMAPKSIVSFDDFVKSHGTFLLYYMGVSANSSLDELLLRNCAVRLEGKKGAQLLFRCGCG